MSDCAILLIEDNDLNRELATDLLELAGHIVVGVPNAEEGLVAARTGAFALVLMDVSLPGMDGLTATRILRSDPVTRHLPVVALTAHAMRDDERQALEAGCVGYVTKPIDTRTFCHIVASPLRPAAGNGVGRMSVIPFPSESDVRAAPGPAPKRLLIVDDEPLNRELLEDLALMLGHTSVTAADGAAALAALDPSIDLVLMDVMMPGMDGYEAVRRIRCEPRFAAVSDVPVIMSTALSDRADRLVAVECGANDFITKPIDLVELRIRTASLLKMKDAQDALKRQRQTLEETVVRRTAELCRVVADLERAGREVREAHLETLQRLALAAERRDSGTAAHLRRVSRYCVVLGHALGLPGGDVEALEQSSVLHDVGKIGISDTILRKPGALSAEERAAINLHPLIGAEMLAGSSAPLLQAGEVIARTHHEHWDGRGYPHGLVGEAIPLYGRICAIADVFDALTSRRPYKQAFPLDRAFDIMRDGRGTQFDPALLDLFFAHRPAIAAIWRQHNPEDAEDIPRSSENSSLTPPPSPQSPAPSMAPMAA